MLACVVPGHGGVTVQCTCWLSVQSNQRSDGSDLTVHCVHPLRPVCPDRLPPSAHREIYSTTLEGLPLSEKEGDAGMFKSPSLEHV